ncbi:MAG TPA: hypothetical protein VN665_00355 [Candidatus Paceibacterota bacterium]|nr:hypothetical protein [Candidatus Paceibacterota bacterium]
MGKRGPKPKESISTEWSANLAYAIGLLTTDGSLSKDGRHIILVSKDKEQLQTFIKALVIKVPISLTRSGYTGKTTTRIQFSNISFYQFLLTAGLYPNKTKTIGELNIPSKYFFDFLRGSFDGDGSTYSYFDPRWKSSFMFYTAFASASYAHIIWLQKVIHKKIKIKGHITKAKNSSVFQLKYAKKDSVRLLKKMYPNKKVLCLLRKRLKIEKMLSIVGEHL